MCSGTINWPDFNVIPTEQYAGHRQELLQAFQAVRAHSRKLTHPFSETEHQIQSMPDASPAKWHLAHTTWFFETFILQHFKPDFVWFDKHFCYLFNSYYNAIGKQYPRPERGLMTNPDLEGVWNYRNAVDHEMVRLITTCDDRQFEQLAPTLVLGLNHEQQHQELIVTDIKHGLYQSAPDNCFTKSKAENTTGDHSGWLSHEGGLVSIGYAGHGFCFDNELAVHQVHLTPFKISKHLVTAGQWLEFMEDGGYQAPLLWLSDGWQWLQEQNIDAPQYWRIIDGERCRFTINGWVEVNPDDPVRHISYYEADAFAQWAGVRLPRESEWEAVFTDQSESLEGPGQCWEWTQSAYSAYPGFKPTPGDAGEYNGKFMVNQMVLRGSSPATPNFHSRPSYRNFFYPGARWQYSGLRLAKDG
ncbi:MAG TPA: ergothioneine biosynthesis protein EgtB [Xanthomonadales bacterium]|nr:ergothioneine biosynthesis protein EgtB [Xanthomonadales bacterium]